MLGLLNSLRESFVKACRRHFLVRHIVFASVIINAPTEV